VGLKKWNLEVLEKEGTKASLLGPPRTGKSASGLLKKEPQKKKVMRKGPATNLVGTTLVLVPRANGGNQWYHENPKRSL